MNVLKSVRRRVDTGECEHKRRGVHYHRIEKYFNEETQRLNTREICEVSNREIR